MFDKKDLRIMALLKEDSSLTTGQISRKTGIPVTTVHNRIRKLKSSGAIRNFTVVFDFEKIGRAIKAYILINVNQSDKKVSQDKVGKDILKIDGVESVDIVAGSMDLIVVVRVESIKVLNEVVVHKLRNVRGVDKTQTILTLKEII